MAGSTSAAAAAGVELRVERLRKSYGSVPAVREVTFDVPPGTMTSLIGPSGCGKTTTLRMIAGLEQADEGTIHAGERLLTNGRSATPPERRDMGMVFQSYALWPHMTVAENVAYGLKRRAMPSSEIASKVATTLGIVGMAKLSERYPGQLSGGQQQRVALARSIATEPSILLFDEPLSNLDAVLREQMRFEIRSLQQRLGITAVYVTHSQDEALVLSDQIAVMHDGVIEQRGAPLDIYHVPRTEFVASFIGLANILSLQQVQRSNGEVAGVLANGQHVRARSGALEALDNTSSTTKLSVRPVDVRILPASRASGRRPANANQLAGVVTNVTFTGGLVDYFVTLDGGGEIPLRAQDTPPIGAKQGERIVAQFDAERAVLLEA